jgi:tetratricopeptide (TPR) repeat protein
MAAKRPRAQARAHTAGPRVEPHAGRSAIVGLAAVIVLAGAWAFSNSLGGVFVLDDIRAIVRNPTIRGLASSIRPPGESTVAGRPVANLSFALNYRLAAPDAREAFQPARPGEDPRATDRFLANARGYHALNLAIHLAASLVLFGVVRRTLLATPRGSRLGDGASGVAAAVALIWVVHPLQTESVTYVVQRVESLMGLFYLLTLYAAIRATEGRRRAAWTALAFVSCALGMATKEVMVTAPVVVAVWLLVFRPDAPRRVLLGGLAATWLVFAALVASEGRGASIAYDAGIAWRYLLTQADVLVHYLRLSAVPAPLVLLYDWPLAASVTGVLPEALLIVALLGVTLAALVRRHPLGFAGAAFFLILAPTSSVLPIVTEVAAEHRMYLPLAIVVACAASAAYLALTALAPRVRMAIGVALTLVLVIAFGTMTRARNRDYSSEEALWGQTVAAHPQGPRARVAFGTALATARRLPEAELQFRSALAINRDDPIAHARLGSVLAAQNKLEAALPHFQRAVALRPADADANRALGQIYAIRHDDRRALEHFGRAAEVVKTDPALLARMAAILVETRDPTLRDPTRALALAEQAATLSGRREAQVLEILAAAHAAAGQNDAAVGVLREALAIARQQGNENLATRLEYRIKAYEAQPRL